MTNLILCGGSGTRLWPLSRTLMPKQFVELFDDASLFQKTVERNRGACTSQLIVSNTEQYFLAMDQLESLGITDASYILEPIGRNTAPAITLACLTVDPDEVVLVTPSDHLIKDQKAYATALKRAKMLAEDGYLVTFGITPRYPETGFGYIEADGEDVRAFHEKPDEKTAENYLQQGNYYWNSGMFCFKAGVLLDEMRKCAPTIMNAAADALKDAPAGEMVRIRHEAMHAIPEDSIDYAVMERSDRVKVVPADMGWSDVGSFDALAEELPNDDRNNLVISEKVTELIDVDDLIVVDTADALLVAKKGSSQKVKAVVAKLKADDSELPNIHVTAHRPWGTYTILDESSGYKVKRIVVKPGKRLSLQKHHHRSEHWVVVSGTAKVVKGEEAYTVCANESTYIPIGELHRLENIGKIPLVMIEAQVGEYVGEDDIVRISDDFKRD